MKKLLLIALVLVCSQVFSQQRMLRLSASKTVSIDSVALGTEDTLRLASTQYSWIKIRGTSGTTDSVTVITGGLSYGLYIFSAAADDTTIVLVDGGNLKLGANVTLDALTDMVLTFFDGTNFRQISAVSNND